MKRALAAFALLASALQLSSACGGQGCGPVDEATKRIAPVGKVIGFVRLEAAAALPIYPELMLGREPLRPRSNGAPIPSECAEANLRSRTPVRMTEQRGLSGLVVTASDFRRARKRGPTVHRVRIERCALTPQTIAMSEGDRLTIENTDAFAFAPLYGPAYSAKPLAQGKPQIVPVFPGTIEPLACSSDAPCGRSDVFVLHHQVHAVTDAQGAFQIESFPAGEQVRLTVVHPLFEDAEAAVWVEPGEQARLDLVVRPKPRFLAHVK